jgi:7,8-dihydropterin-6-yl-methyl-4-(beta-D-ribofuranosyl)aminobenzene 5'-phosphate synthase
MAGRLTVAYDNEAAIEGPAAGWGFSCLIEMEGLRLLFDTGWDGELLVSNLRRLGKDPAGIDTVFLSHGHWDHIGGLPAVLALNPKARVFLPASLSRRLKEEIARRAEVVGVRGPVEVAPGCLSTGELGTDIPEQSLLVRTGGGLLVVTGCAHPGLGSMLEAAGRHGKVRGVVGGFHGFDDYGLLRDLPLIMPCHCTSHAREIGERFPAAFRRGGAGAGIELGSG